MGNKSGEIVDFSALKQMLSEANATKHTNFSTKKCINEMNNNREKNTVENDFEISNLVKYEKVLMVMKRYVKFFKEYYKDDLDSWIRFLETSLYGIRLNDYQENSLINVPTTKEGALQSLEIFEEVYTDFDYVKGTMGLVSEVYQEDGIMMMSFYALLANRKSKMYQRVLDIYNRYEEIYGKDPKELSVDEYVNSIFSDSDKNLHKYIFELLRKDNNKNFDCVGDIIEDLEDIKYMCYRDKRFGEENLLASIYVLQNTSDFYKERYSYGNTMDNEGNEAFVIDLPYVGAISFHYGFERNKNHLINNATKKARDILQEKLRLETSIQKRKRIENAISRLDDKNAILPEYAGKLYEFKSAFPIPSYNEREGLKESINELLKKIGIKDVLEEDFTEEHLRKVLNYEGLNNREKRYLLIRIGLFKSALDRFQEMIDGINIGRGRKSERERVTGT